MFAGFRHFGHVVSTYLLIGIIVVLLSMTFIGIPVAIWLGVLWVYAIVLVVDRGVGFGEATGGSKQLVKGTGWWMTFLSLFVGGIVFGIISSILNFIPVVGSIVAGLMYPLVFAYLVAMYFQATGEVQLVDNAVAGLPPAAAGAGPYGAPSAGGAYVPPAPPAPPAGAAYAPPAAPEQPARARRAPVSRSGRPRPTRSRASRPWRHRWPRLQVRRRRRPPRLHRRRPHHRLRPSPTRPPPGRVWMQVRASSCTTAPSAVR